MSDKYISSIIQDEHNIKYQQIQVLNYIQLLNYRQIL